MDKKKTKADMEQLWVRVKKTVVDGATVAAEKTQEFTKLGKAKIDVLNTKRKISRTFTELGGLIYDAIKANKIDDVMKSAEVKAIIAALKDLEAELDAKEEKFEDLKKKDAE